MPGNDPAVAAVVPETLTDSENPDLCGRGVHSLEVSLACIFHEHFAHFKVTSVNHMIKLRIIPYFKFAKCSPKASRCDRT
ncbi:MAG: hypothetical protein U9P36_15025, partial [Thermodesulfobacteriota bacterium]|nr:hypothetical protein [Thermodesulfobacteriota bacterium]